MLYTILTALLIVLDQVVKHVIRTGLEPGEQLPFLPGILGLTYVKNTGAAFSLLSDHTWLLTLLSAVAVVLLAVALFRGSIRHPMGRVFLSLLLAGAAGNLIDRAIFGCVTDMFRTLFMTFPVFNVADICVVCGGIGLTVYVLFFYERWELPHGD